MAEVQSNDQGGGGKNKQKKQTLRVDFTPMVDMNMLLITFFMLCTTLLKPQNMPINMPTNDDTDIDMTNKVRESTAVTILLGADNTIYYYEGKPDDDGSSFEDPNFITETKYGAGGIRDLLIQKNRGVYTQIQELKEKLARLEISDEQFREQSRAIQDKAIKDDKTAPTVMIKPSDKATYKNMVDALDEMLVCNIGSYAILDIADGDRRYLYNKTGNPDYLSAEELAGLSGNSN